MGEERKRKISYDPPACQSVKKKFAQKKNQRSCLFGKTGSGAGREDGALSRRKEGEERKGKRFDLKKIDT